MMNKISTILVAMLTAICIHATEFTVADGSATSEKVPVYGFYGDALCHNQLIYPATLLQDIKGNSIQSLSFYPEMKASEAWDAIWKISVAIVDKDHFESDAFGSGYYYNEAEGTVVYEGTLDGTGETMTIAFNTPFAYEEGNLLVDIITTTKGTKYPDATFLGQEGEGITAVYGGNSFNMPTAPMGGAAFLPKTTFVVDGEVAAPCVEPEGLKIDSVSSDYVRVSWSAGGEESQWQYVLVSLGQEPDWSQASLSTEPQAVFDNLAASTDYTFFVRAYCAADRQSDELLINIQTDCGIVTALPWSEDFEKTANMELPGCWSRISESSSPYVSSMGTHASARCLLFNLEAGESQIVILPEMEVSFADQALDFWYNTSGYKAELEAGYISGSEESPEFHAISEPFGKVEDYTHATNVVLKNVAPEARHLAFRYTAQEACYVYIDDIKIDAAVEEDPQGLEEHQPASESTLKGKVHKVLREGQLYLMYKGTMYDVQGKRTF